MKEWASWEGSKGVDIHASNDQENMILCLGLYGGEQWAPSGRGERKELTGSSMCLLLSKCHADTRDLTRSHVLQGVEQELEPGSGG